LLHAAEDVAQEFERWFAAHDIDHVAQVDALISGIDITDDCRRIAIPTLVAGRRGTDARQCADLAAHIPGAQMYLSEGTSISWQGDIEHPLPTMLAFLAEGYEPAAVARHASNSAPIQSLLFTDLEGHVAMMSRLGDVEGRAVLREHEARTRQALAAHGGAEVKAMGDGFMASFASAQDALRCAIAIQRAFAEPDAGEELRVRIGVNAGEPIAEDEDFFGASVIAAARIAALASGGQTLIANVVRELVAGKGFLFRDAGEHRLKGLEEPIRVWELRADEP